PSLRSTCGAPASCRRAPALWTVGLDRRTDCRAARDAIATPRMARDPPRAPTHHKIRRRARTPNAPAMPHLVILYTPQLDRETDMAARCRKLADAMIAQRDEAGQAVFPIGGTRVLAYPAAHFAVADGGAAARAQGKGQDCAFAYFNLRMARGRSDAVK